uniref:Uncharacterized protein n=1 Tax=Picea glauca TaxID=3330 RepID=A0A101LWM1_PICGL|nr:hypothetical protein ABT39_MTgene1375 [Picea glauca]QHR89472.1 hypothetical protein Q903MT_gene3493 [Picea sitchensis]
MNALTHPNALLVDGRAWPGFLAGFRSCWLGLNGGCAYFWHFGRLLLSVWLGWGGTSFWGALGVGY